MDEDLAQRHGQVLQELRETVGMTREELARAADISGDYVAKIERGERSPSLKVREAVARSLGTDRLELDDLFERAEHDDVSDDIRRIAERSIGLVKPQPLAGLDPMPTYQYISPRLARAQASEELMEFLDDLVGQVDDWQASELAALEQTLESLIRLPPERREAAEAVIRFLASPQAEDADPAQLRDMLVRLTRAGTTLVATAAPGERFNIATDAVAADDRDHLWVDPLAPAWPNGDDETEPRIERYVTGRVVLDTTRLASTPSWSGLDSARHVTRAMLSDERNEDDDPSALTAVFEATVIDLRYEDRTLVVSPRPAGQTIGDFPEGNETIHVVTAYNPRGRLARYGENRERNRMLRNELDRRGWSYLEASGRSPDGSWSEESFAVVDIDRHDVLELARAYEQTAIFEWTPTHRAVVWCDPDVDEAVHGWEARVVET